MTVCTQDRDMRPCEQEVRLGMARQVISRRSEGNLSVTGFAAVRISSPGELSSVHVRMAPGTRSCFQFVFSISSGRFVAQGAFHGRVLTLERK